MALRGSATAETLPTDATRLIVGLLDRLRALGIGVPETARVLGLYPAGLDGEFEIVAAVEGAEEVTKAAGSELPGPESLTLPGGPFAAVSHVGAYEELPLAYHALAVWLHAHGHRLVGPMREIYVSDPSVTPPASLVTQVMVPIVEA